MREVDSASPLNQANMSLFLERCQVDTPTEVVKAAWDEVNSRRAKVGRVVDFGAGDGRFSRHGTFEEYFGFEVDPSRVANSTLGPNCHLVARCAFEHDGPDFDLCIGNPPYVRNQDLPPNWRLHASSSIRRRSDIELSGLANAYQYFFLLGLVSTASDGLVVMVLPHEWLTRPSAKRLRDYIRSHKWSVTVLRLPDQTFSGVLTTASITIVDKASRDSRWRTAEYSNLPSAVLPAPSSKVLPYASRRTMRAMSIKATRGLSPGSQKALVLTEAERARAGLRPDRDVVRCITSLKPAPAGLHTLNEEAFDGLYRNAGKRCWLINASTKRVSLNLKNYLENVPASLHDTATCKSRDVWWRFKMPDPPQALIASAFKGDRPKLLVNSVRAIAVGSATGLHGPDRASIEDLVKRLGSISFAERTTPYARGLHKIEIGQLNRLILTITRGNEGDARHV